jgi:hypothetical protein
MLCGTLQRALARAGACHTCVGTASSGACMASELMPPPAHRDLEAEAEPKLRPGPVAPLAGTLGLDALDVPVGLPVGLPDPLDGLDAFGAVLAAPCVRPPLGIVNAFSDVPDDMFGPSFWLDGPAGELEGGSAPPPAFPSVCSAPVSMAGAGLRRGDGAPLGRPKAQAVPQLLAAKASCESITEHFTNSFDAGADAVERACASAAAAPLPPLPPCSPSHSETSSSPRRTLDSGRVLSPNSSSNPSPNPSIMSAAAQPEPMQEDACLQDLTLLDPEAQRAAGVSAPAPTGIRCARPSHWHGGGLRVCMHECGACEGMRACSASVRAQPDT